MIVSSVSPRSDPSLGIVYTPLEIADAIVRSVVALAPEGYASVLEPSAGDGAFLQALEDVGTNAQVTAVDIEPQAVVAIRNRFPAAHAVEGDFFQFAARPENVRTFDLIIGNPPYVRRKNFGPQICEALDELAERQNFTRHNLKNAWAAFIVAAEALLTNEGVLAFVVPYELVNVNYGIALQSWLVSRFDRIDIYIPDEKAFKQIDQDAVLIVAQRAHLEKGAFVRQVASLLNLESTPRAVDLSDLDKIRANLKAFLLDTAMIERVHGIRAECPSMERFCRNGTGIVTAANAFFILSDEEVERQALKDWAIPILKKSAYLGIGPVFSDQDFELLRTKLPANLIDLNSYDSDSPDLAVERYLEKGRSEKRTDSFKARHRQFWYKVPITWVGQGFFFKRCHSFPRICINDAGVHVTDTAYSIEPLFPATMRGICYSFYNSVTLLMCEIEGRFYGGGVLELTPNEFRRLPIYYTEPSDEEFSRFCEADIWSDEIRLAQFGDQILIEKHGFSQAAIADFHSAWQALRRHRLRHGRRPNVSKVVE